MKEIKPGSAAARAVNMAKKIKDKGGLGLGDKIFEKLHFTGRILVNKNVTETKMLLNESTTRYWGPELTAMGKKFLSYLYDENSRDGRLVNRIVQINTTRDCDPELIYTFNASGRVIE